MMFQVELDETGAMLPPQHTHYTHNTRNKHVLIYSDNILVGQSTFFVEFNETGACCHPQTDATHTKHTTMQ